MKEAIRKLGASEAAISIAEIHASSKNTRVVIQFEKSATKKASQLRTEARNKWSPMDASGKVTHSLRDGDGHEIRVRMFSPEWMKEYNQPLYELKSMYSAQYAVEEREVRVDTKRGTVMHGDNILAVRRFDGAVMLSPYIMSRGIPDTTVV